MENFTVHGRLRKGTASKASKSLLFPMFTGRFCFFGRYDRTPSEHIAVDGGKWLLENGEVYTVSQYGQIRQSINTRDSLRRREVDAVVGSLACLWNICIARKEGMGWL
ncbi:hypothetical protein R1flu_020684 [Riccia fluitans]|uniref:Uncharacterized protein n=1 Tax=Riccia fluitans TaxID=41844 RepID=A0ABD1ZNU6_9MARC